MEKLKAFFNILWKIVLFILTPLFLIYKFGIKKPVEHVKLRKKIKESQKEVKEILKSNENTNKIIDSLYNDWSDDYKSFRTKLKLRRRRKTN